MVTNTGIIDISQIAFLDMLREMIAMAGPAVTKGTLIRLATKAGKQLKAVAFDSWNEFLAAVETATNPIAVAEGPATHYGNGLFGLKACPFAGAISNYKNTFGALPETYASVTSEFNKPGPGTDSIRVGNGAGVSPFCSVHQPMRATAARQITVGGKPLEAQQLGCKSAAGSLGIAKRWIEEGGWSEDAVRKVLENNMCCYAVKVKDAVEAATAPR
jgi:hypothetical protein